MGADRPMTSTAEFPRNSATGDRVSTSRPEIDTPSPGIAQSAKGSRRVDHPGYTVNSDWGVVCRS